MISTYAVNVQIIKEFFDHNPRAFIEFLNGDDSEKRLLVNKHNAIRFLVNELYKSGFNVRQIAQAMDLPPLKVKKLINKQVSNGFFNLLEFLDPFTAIKKSDGYGISVVLTKRKVRTILAINLIQAGWSDRKVAKAVGISERTANRIRKRIERGEYE